MARQLYSKSALATELGVDRRTLDARIDTMAPAEIGPRGAQLYYLKDVFRAFMVAAEDAAAQRKRRSLLPSPSSDPLDPKAHNQDLASAKLRREQAEAELAEIKVAKERGVLIEADRVESLWGNLVVAMRAKMLSLPGRASVQTEGMSVKAVERRLDDLVREALAELAGAGDDEEGEADDAED